MSNAVAEFALDMFVSGSLFLTVTFLYFKLSAITINSIYKKPITIVLGCLFISLVYSSIYMVNISFSQIVGFLYPALFFVAFEKKSVVLKLISCFIITCITRVLMIIPSIIISLILAYVYPNFTIYPVFIYTATFASAVLLVRIKRFRKGIQFFQDEKYMGVGIALSGCLFLLFSISYTHEHLEDFLRLLVVAGLLIVAFGLYLWIRRNITAHYREKMKLRSEEYNKQTLAETEQTLEKMQQSNEFLAKIVHRDNHLISALNTSIDDYFNSDDKSFKDDLLRDIQTLAKERTELIDKEQREAKILPSTGNLLIDSSINDLYFKAVAHGIDFDIDVSAPVDEIIGKYLSQTELQTLLCDHIKDAIIAVDAKGEGSGKILVSLSVKDNNYDITIFDSGVDFEIDTLSKLGKERVTTHAEDGGSGIGFMTTFETLKKSYASLIITENENKIPFSKSISIRFDGLSAFVIQSYRAEKLKSAIKREDITIV